ncbi:MAG: hypothetical protein LIO76_01210 [Clostridiales bacterium]|nr:hypothetical protein [Clostridiales bacterium]
MPKFHIDEIEKETLAGLKDFQRATVDRIDQLYRSGQNRVLIADEVGMGKTLVARGAIVKVARLRMEEQDELFKVVYICSNQTIASQNIRKLDITGGNAIDSVTDTRLSMQHLKIAQQESSEKVKEGFIQLMPLTPETSFHMTSGGGSVNERALMYAVLKRMDEFKEYLGPLDDFMQLDAQNAWSSWAKQRYEEKVQECEKQSGGKYPANVINKIREYSDFEEIRKQLIIHLRERTDNRALSCSNYKMMNRLRVMFARISVSMLEPDLVIMDEFQRFKYLLSYDDSEMGILAQKFLSGRDTRILLLSATPYKLYSTMEEIEENQIDEHYAEFYQVMDFLFEGKQEEFHTVWKNYSVALVEMKSGQDAVIQIEDRKKQAQDEMYQGICRTERISVMESGDYTDDSSVHEHLTIHENDIASYLQMAGLLKKTDSKDSLPADYVKSCPYLMSFMRKYKLKESLEQYFRKNPERVKEAKGDLLWIDESKINHYEKLPGTNARLAELMDRSLGHGEEMLLWIPPSKPYYTLQGVYKDSKCFSKILVFSSWEMVPRMIGSLVSYEAERKTIGQLAKQADNRDKKNAVYFPQKNIKNESGANAARFPAPRLQFHVSGGQASSMSLFCLLYPSAVLAEAYDPIALMNGHMSLKEIEGLVGKKLESRLDGIEKRYGTGFMFGRADERWYYLAPMLLDGIPYVQGWIADIKKQMQTDNETFMEKGNKGFLTHIARLERYISDPDHIALGKRPADLVKILVNMALGSPAICAYRSNGQDEAKATELARVFVNNFNLPEATAIIDLAYGKSSDDNSHWQNVLKYCRDGCLQSMLDEYRHILSESVGFGDEEDKTEVIHTMMVESLRIHTASYAVDTYRSFSRKIAGKNTDEIRIRSNFAVGFTKDAGDNESQINRKESVRNAFNSPMRPFVLATTSIGQEGLDFHNYCRKVMHWNLPSNPIDLEQREGRVNRFKCLAIRQNVAERYGDITFKNDVWAEMFAAAAEGEKQEGQSELVPFWCFGKNQDVKIERIVPMYPVSRDEVNYERLVKILSMYRLTLGQARQEELLDYIFKEFDDTEKLKDLFMDLSPYSRIAK